MTEDKKNHDFWEPPKSAKIIIVCAACRYGDFIVTGARHWDNIMINTVRKIYGNSSKEVCSKSDQGFIDQYGRFYSRQEAYQIVQENGQPFNAARNTIVGELYSEGLY